MAESIAEYATLAAVDLGSNSFHCQVARVVSDQIYPLDALREPVRLGAGLREDKQLDDSAQERALACLQRFGERLRGFDRHAVRAVGTNTLRVAKNATAFLKRAQAALGFPIEVIAGREEARLIYLGVQHSLPPSKEKRLVVDVGGGSTEFIIGSGYKPAKLASLYMGCVSYSLRFFPDGKITRSAMKRAELAARNELQPIVAGYSRKQWQQAVGSSGTIRALAEIAQLNGFSTAGITPAGLDKLRASLIKAGDVARLGLAGIRPDRLPVLPGGLAILSAVLSELGISEMTAAGGAMREGLLYDLLGRVHHKDMRDVTVAQFMQRYHVDASQARRVGTLAQSLYRKLTAEDRNPDENAPVYIGWAAKLHEIGISVAYTGYHKHSAYILEKADMPGFSRNEQGQLSLLVLAHRRSLKKVFSQLNSAVDWRSVLALRLAALFYRGRSDIALPAFPAKAQGSKYRLGLDGEWLTRNPLTATALLEETKEWEKIGFELRIPGLAEAEAASEVAVTVQ
ncbi:MAG: exopolyphosphatase / guanosine-5-triphosphate,3-diphosphate pyrophosphatase [Betaproteobacteria bacterium]|jgi:exopolyphosphatase/guanosine-5'-triphosphate,3'-diphosphate pyrophosphatase